MKNERKIITSRLKEVNIVIMACLVISIFIVAGIIISILQETYPLIILLGLVFLFVVKLLVFKLKLKKIFQAGTLEDFEIIDNERSVRSRGIVAYYPMVQSKKDAWRTTFYEVKSTSPFLIGSLVKGIRYKTEVYLLL